MFIRAAVRLRSPAGPRARLSVAYFHRVLPSPDPRHPDVPDQRLFERQLRWLSDCFHVLPLSEAIDRLREGTLPAGSAAISFDDGYADNYLWALPVLKKCGLHATFFIATGYLDGGIMWNDAIHHAVHGSRNRRLDANAIGFGVFDLADGNDRNAIVGRIISELKRRPFVERAAAVQALVAASGVELPCDLMLSTEQLMAMHAAGMGIGAHTVNHPILASCQSEQAQYEIRESKRVLETILGVPIDLFAYPNGKIVSDYLPEHAIMVREAGFKAALTTMEGVTSRSSDFYQIPRFLSWDHSSLKFRLRMLANLNTLR